MPQLAQQAGLVFADRVIFADFFSRLTSFFIRFLCGFGMYFG